MTLRATLGRSLRAIALSLAIAALTAIVVFIASYILHPVTGVRVEGARMLPESTVWDTVSDRESLLTLNTRMVRQKIQSNPWVESVRVTKQWRSGIVLVEVEERKAVLDAELDGRRIVFAADGTRLPGLGGADLNRVKVEEDQVAKVLEAGKILRSHGSQLESVDNVSAEGIEATVDGRKVMLSGALGDVQAEALPDIMRRNPDATLFDLRSPGRVVVSAEPISSRDREPGE